MYIDTDKIVPRTAANQNFSAIARQNDLANARAQWQLVHFVSVASRWVLLPQR